MNPMKIIPVLIFIIVFDLMYLLYDAYYQVKALTWKPQEQIMGYSTLTLMPEFENDNLGLKIMLKGMYRFY